MKRTSKGKFPFFLHNGEEWTTITKEFKVKSNSNKGFVTFHSHIDTVHTQVWCDKTEEYVYCMKSIYKTKEVFDEEEQKLKTIEYCSHYERILNDKKCNFWENNKELIYEI